MTFDPSTLCVFCNAEGKHFPQKILYLQPNNIIARKYNFFSENILHTIIPPYSDFVYSCGINGLVYKMSKQDIQRNLVKQKEKLKNKQVQKLFAVKADNNFPAISVRLDFTAPTEDPSEDYLFAEGQSAITAMHLAPLSNDKAIAVFSLRNVPVILFTNI